MIIIVNKKKRKVIGKKEFKIACNDQIFPHSSFAKFTFECNTDLASPPRKIAPIFISRLKGKSTLFWKKVSIQVHAQYIQLRFHVFYISPPDRSTPTSFPGFSSIWERGSPT